MVGENFTDGFVASTNGVIFYSLNPDYYGRNVRNIAELEFKDQFNQGLQDTVVLTSADHESLISITPLWRNNVHLGYLYIKTGTTQADHQRDTVVRLFITGSILCIFLTSFIILLSFNFIISRRINRLLGTIKLVESGDLKVRIPQARSSDEIATLEEGINSMTAQLEELFNTLEHRVNARTQDLQIAANVAKHITTVLDINELLHQVVAQTTTGFNLFASIVYLLDNNQLVYASGVTSDSRALDRLPELTLDHNESAIAQAARQCETIVINDFAQETRYQPQFPETRSELAIPMLLGKKLLGVFDLQSQVVNRFGKEELSVMPIVAEQTAIAVRNAQLFSEARSARDAAEEANRIKSQFLANMSHELRTPLNAILNCTGFVFDELYGPLNEKQVDNLQRVLDSGEYLLSLINDILDITKIETGVVDLFIQRVDLNAVLDDVITTAKALIRNKPIELFADVELALPLIWGDNRRIRQIMLNLISNAIKFTRQGRITISAHREQDDIHMTVADTGIGIAPSDHERVFETFYQIKQSLPGVTGTGLGLSISKHFVEVHGGRIWLESASDAGTTFHVVLPVDNQALVPEKSL
jgi:signal transduction histidine kinase/HAMP domain-containing protein